MQKIKEIYLVEEGVAFEDRATPLELMQKLNKLLKIPDYSNRV